MYDPNLKDQAKQMREKGLSIGDISSNLLVSKSTVSFWCKDIKLKDFDIQNIKTNGRRKSILALLRYSESKREERIIREKNQRNEGALSLGKLSERDILMTGFGLYWGEGYKEGELGFTNSNPKIIKFYLLWLKLFEVEKENLIFRLTINKIFKDQEDEIKTFWVNSLGVNSNQFSKTTFTQTKLKKAFTKNNQSYKGILRVKVRKGTHLKNKILGSIDYISDWK